MKPLSYPPRKPRVLLRLREDELARAIELARAWEVLVPELLRRLLHEAWQQANGQRGPASIGVA